MKPESASRRLFGITRSKGKMYELDLPVASHIAVPKGLEPQDLFMLTVGTLGDAAATIADSTDREGPLPKDVTEDLSFSASFFDAYLESKFSMALDEDLTLLASAAYYLANRPGSSLVLARRLSGTDGESVVDALLRWVLKANWNSTVEASSDTYGDRLAAVSRFLLAHFKVGMGREELEDHLVELRRQAYRNGSSRDLLLIDTIAAICRLRMAASTWSTLPAFSNLDLEQWRPTLSKEGFPKELWPSQVLLGRAGIYSGACGVVQMPTSAGKTRSVEIVLRSGFLSERTRLAVVVAPFRALCHEIANSLRQSFKGDDIKVNELSDALQLDFEQQIAELLGIQGRKSGNVLVVTPEKLLYVLRQSPTLVKQIGIVVYDEGHQFDSGIRGITYELLLTEIKALLPETAQTVLVSAVIQNAQQVGDWLMGHRSQVINGATLLPTSRSVAFASWLERLGQLQFFETSDYSESDYFVPRVIEPQTLQTKGRERKKRIFPEKDSNDIALYLSLRLVRNGSVAVFCGRKDTASNVAKRAVEIFEREVKLPKPAETADIEEIRKLKRLIEAHFGPDYHLSTAAALGIFVHHANTPHGIRLAVEAAMQRGRIKFVACTSTLAQGVNLPIRYLIVSGVHQGQERISVRDFQNLIGRAGRSGMYTEGLVIFSDPSIYDQRNSRGFRSESWKFKGAVELLNPEKAEQTASSLLKVLEPFKGRGRDDGITLAADELCTLLLSDEEQWQGMFDNIAQENPDLDIEPREWTAECRHRRKMIFTIESYLMANRGDRSFDDFRSAAESLATSTLAYHLGDDTEKAGLQRLFSLLAEHIESTAAEPERQASYAKTLLGASGAKSIDDWIEANRERLLGLRSNTEWLEAIWPLFVEHIEDKFFHSIEPLSTTVDLATYWMQGRSYEYLFAHAVFVGATKPWGDDRRTITNDDILDFCEGTLGFDCGLVVAAVGHFLYGSKQEDGAESLALFQKCLKYGLPGALPVSCYEAGFADRMIAQHLSDTVRANGYDGNFFTPALDGHGEVIEEALRDYPSYFSSIFQNLT